MVFPLLFHTSFFPTTSGKVKNNTFFSTSFYQPFFFMYSSSCGQPTSAWLSSIASSMTSRMMAFRSVLQHVWQRRWNWYVECAKNVMVTREVTPLKRSPAPISSIPSKCEACSCLAIPVLFSSSSISKQLAVLMITVICLFQFFYLHFQVSTENPV